MSNSHKGTLNQNPTRQFTVRFRFFILILTFFQDFSLVSAYIQDHALANTPKRTIPPVDVIIYAARNILYPSFLYSDIPELLDLLSIVEFYRLRVIEVARNASLWNNYYKTSKETDRDILTREEEKILKRLTKESRIQAQRYVYRTLISQCCQLVRVCRGRGLQLLESPSIGYLSSVERTVSFYSRPFT
jgi:hypothetical protein